MIQDYEKQVYTAILGKVIGVYLGRPVEGWTRERIQEKWGEITRYVHDDCGVPLVVADDDISGTLTFIRALTDSGLYEKTPDDFFGRTWLNYLIPGKTILWWGNMCNSTEHTAYIRLKQGYRSPESGSMKLNGKEVAEQIGAQIFIDCFGMVAPGRPELAVKLAGKAAGVSHDGEAVYAAQTVAAMIGIAFEEKDMNRILDRAAAFIPQDSLIAQVHRDVRAWAKMYPDWNDTFEKIKEKYGYKKYGGGCHVIPNHAVMVMAWAYGQNDFYRTMSIVNTAGWDTDCNAANVGTVTALCAGLEHLCDTYDFRSPFADRLFVPTADGTCSVSDVLEQALSVAKTGRRIMGMPELPAPKNGAKYHFEMPGACHGFLPVTENASAVNTEAPSGFSGKYCLEFRFDAAPERPGRIETPLAASSTGGYSTPYTPALYSGNTLRMKGILPENGCSLKMYLAMADGEIICSAAAEISDDGSFDLSWTADFTGTVTALGIEASSGKSCRGKALIDFIGISGVSRSVSEGGNTDFRAWISSMAGNRLGPFSNDVLPGMRYFMSNEEPGVLVTGNRTWGDTRLSLQFKIHSADRAGVLVHYQGLCRWIGVIFSRRSLRIIRNYYGEQTLAETDFICQENELMQLDIRTCGTGIEVFLDGRLLLNAQDDLLKSGGSGIYVDHGCAGFGRFSAEAETGILA